MQSFRKDRTANTSSLIISIALEWKAILPGISRFCRLYPSNTFMMGCKAVFLPQMTVLAGAFSQAISTCVARSSSAWKGTCKVSSSSSKSGRSRPIASIRPEPAVRCCNVARW